MSPKYKVDDALTFLYESNGMNIVIGLVKHPKDEDTLLNQHNVLFLNGTNHFDERFRGYNNKGNDVIFYWAEKMNGAEDAMKSLCSGKGYEINGTKITFRRISEKKINYGLENITMDTILKFRTNQMSDLSVKCELKSSKK